MKAGSGTLGRTTPKSWSTKLVKCVCLGDISHPTCSPSQRTAARGHSMALHRDPPVQQSKNAGQSVSSIVLCSLHISLIPTALSNLHTVQTVTTTKVVTALDKALAPTRTAPLNVLIQVNTSAESSKSGLPPLSPETSDPDSSEIVQLSKYIITTCPRLRLQGLMTIGSLSESLQSETEENHDFRRLRETRDVLQGLLERDESLNSGEWGDDRRLLLSMGMSSDFETAIRAGSDIVRVGSGIFGERLIT